MTFKYRYVIAACARWEAPYALEWLSYHRAIGFEHVYLYCNDDDPAALYQAVLPFTFGPDAFVTFRFFPDQGKHREMMQHFLLHNGEDSEWISFLDLDEFLRLPPGKTLPDFMRDFVALTDCVLFNWVFFGPNGHKTHPRTNVLATYTRRTSRLHPLTKLIARSRVLRSPELFVNCTENSFVHRLAEFLSANIRSVNVLGEDVTLYYDNFPDSAAAFIGEPAREAQIFGTALIHHYAFRSEAAFLQRVARGLNGNFAGEKMWGELAADPARFASFLDYANAVEDRYLADFWDRLIARSQLTNVLTPAALGRPGLISRGKPATQSSLSAWSYLPTREQDAAGAVNGIINGHRKFHTDIEDHPWWQVDLGGLATIRQIKIYNTADLTAVRFRNFSLGISIDGAVWLELVSKTDDVVVGGIYDAAPFIWAGPGTAWARHVRITLLDRNFLHLDQVEIYGELPS